MSVFIAYLVIYCYDVPSGEFRDMYVHFSLHFNKPVESNEIIFDDFVDEIYIICNLLMQRHFKESIEAAILATNFLHLVLYMVLSQ